MPELPEVEIAARRLRSAVVGKTVVRAEVFHPALRRQTSAVRLRSLIGARVARVDRRGKHQLLVLEDGRTVHAHFRMTGDWHIGSDAEPLPRFARAAITFSDGVRVVLDDPRALSTLTIHAASSPPELGLGPEPEDPSLTPDSLLAVLASRRGPIKPVLLDQRVIAGLGNIYAAEALWRARISPVMSSRALTAMQAKKLLSSIRSVIERASGDRYRESGANRFAVYDREGKPCRRCGTRIERVTQAGRSTYFCPRCQPESADKPGASTKKRRRPSTTRAISTRQ